MKLPTGERAQAAVLIVIVLAILAGGYWMLLSSRQAREEDANRFARDASQRLILQHDMRFLNQTLTPHAQMLFPPSWRERFFDQVRSLGPVTGEMNVHGNVTFTSQFFEPTAVFHGDFNAAAGPASVELHFSRSSVRWEIDALNLTWTPDPPPTPPPTPVLPPSPSPSASPKPRRPK